MSAKEHILRNFHHFSPKVREAAKFIVDHPNEVVILSMRRLAEKAGLQPATLFRLARQLGYPGWPALKAAFAADLGLRDKRYGARAQALAGRGKDDSLLTDIFASCRNNLDSMESANAKALREAAALLKKAGRVHIAGFRASFAIAHVLLYGYRLFRNTVHSIDGFAGGLEMQTRAIEKGDAVLVVSFAPYSREAMLVVEAAKTAGATVIALTDSNASPLALPAAAAILFRTDSPSFFPSIAAGIVAAEALLSILVAENSEESIQPIDRAEQNLLDSGAYLQERPPG